MNNAMLGQVLGSVFSGALQRRRAGAQAAPGGMGGLGGMGGMGGAALGGILASVLRGRGGARAAGGNRGMLIALLLPFAMQWVQRNGGIGAVLKRFQERGYGRQAQSWVETGGNQDIDAQAIDAVVGDDALRQLAQQVGAPEAEVKQAFAEILPEMVNQLTPDGQLHGDADDVLGDSIPVLERELRQAQADDAHA